MKFARLIIAALIFAGLVAPAFAGNLVFNAAQGTLSIGNQVYSHSQLDASSLGAIRSAVVSEQQAATQAGYAWSNDAAEVASIRAAREFLALVDPARLSGELGTVYDDLYADVEESFEWTIEEIAIARGNTLIDEVKNGGGVAVITDALANAGRSSGWERVEDYSAVHWAGKQVVRRGVLKTEFVALAGTKLAVRSGPTLDAPKLGVVEVPPGATARALVPQVAAGREFLALVYYAGDSSTGEGQFVGYVKVRPSSSALLVAPRREALNRHG